MKDFFFGDINKAKDGSYGLSLNNVNELGKMVSPDFFRNQLSRLLSESNQLIDLENGTSSPAFHKLISLLHENEIGMVQIGQRTDVNVNVQATLDCSLYFANGIIRVTAHWCAWQDSREREIVDTLLNPLIENDLINKTFITPPKSSVKAISLDKDTASQQLFMLAGGLK